MSIYGDAEGGQESLSSAGKSDELGGAVKICGQDMSDEKTRTRAGISITVVVVIVMLYAFFSDFEWESGGGGETQPHHGVIPTTVGANGEVIFIPAGAPRKLSPGMEHASVNVPLDYQIDFDLLPGPNIVSDWSNIIHLTATGKNCCDYGDRVPGVWFKPGTRQLYVVDGHGGLNHAGGAGNAGCVDANDLEVGRRYRISIQMRQKVVEVFVADCGLGASGQCNAELEPRCTEKREDRIAFPRAQVFASDTFYTPADASIDNFYMSTLAPVRGCTDFSACNHNAQASEDDGSCSMPVPGRACSGEVTVQTPCAVPVGYIPPPPPPYVPGAPPPPPPCMKTQFIPATQPVTLQRGHALGAREPPPTSYQPRQQAFHAVVSLPLDYTVSFTITPAGVQPEWASIVHFTATGNNCCAYGDRTPAVWFHPGNLNLHIVDGQPSNGNDNCNPSDPLTVGVPTTVTIDIGAGFFEVSVSERGQPPRQVCEGLRQNRRPFSHAHVWAADPFHLPALAQISDFWMSGPNMPRAGCMIDAACNRDYKANRPDGSCTFPQPQRGCNGQPVTVSGTTGITQFVPAGQTQRLQQNGHHDIVYMPENARIHFEVTPDQRVLGNGDGWTGWGSIFHFSASGGNCCEYGDRVPAVWFYPDSHRLHIVHGGAGDEGNNDCSPEEELQPLVPTRVRIDIRQTHVEVYYNDQMRCTEPRSEAHEWSPVHMYMSDPWHDAALASISNFYLEHLDPITGCTDPLACNYDERAAIDDQSCNIPSRGTDCNGRTIGNTDGSGTTTFVTSEVPLSNEPGRQFHAVVTVPLDYVISITIIPSNQLATKWSGIFHITATGNNCCEYGDRIPGMWFAPNSRRLTVADGQPSNGNDYWEADEHSIGDLQPNVRYVVTVECRQTTFVVNINGVQAFAPLPRVDRARFPHAHVFAADPWYDPAYASISDFQMTAV